MDIVALVIGFAIGVQFILVMVIGLPGAIALALWGIVGGTVLGAALGYINRA